MSTIPSNPHASQAEQLSVAPANGPEEEAALDKQAQLQATLALAYEQRTANLIAMQALGITDMSDWLPEHSKWWIKRAEEIETRLGETK